MKVRFLILLIPFVFPAVAATVHHWGFEDDFLAPGGKLSAYRKGEPPTYADVPCCAQVWDGGLYAAARDGNRRSVHFSDIDSASLSPVGGEIVFGGGSETLQLPTLTVECFVRVEKQEKRFALLVSKRRRSGSSWSVAINPGGVVMARFDTQTETLSHGFNRILQAGQRVDDGEWHHVAMTFDGDTLQAQLYVDYELCTKGTMTGPLVYDDGELTIGRGLEGWVDEVRLSSATLHPEQFLRRSRFFSDAVAKKRKDYGVMIDLTPTRVQTSVSLEWEQVGTLRPKAVDEIPGDFWSLGCETLDRDLADWDAYRGYLQPLGIRRIRLQGGWAKTEKQKGVYDFEWLDHIIDSAHKLGLEVCLETSYGNRLYEPAAALGPGGAIPSGEETLAAWDAWVEAMARRYSRKGVREWMMYNEPNLNRKNTPAAVVAFNARTAAVIKRVDPGAKIAGLVVAGASTSWIEKWLKGLQEMGKLNLFEWVIYHGYGANPDSLAPGMRRLKELVRSYSPTLKLWQGEAGCASEEVQYALSGIGWTEISHAKWNARRMLCDFAHGIESTVFTISDLSYQKDFISRYGLLKTSPDNSIIKVKAAYYVVNNVVSVFNGAVHVDADAEVDVTPGKGVAAYAFKHAASGHNLIALWDAGSIPAPRCELATVDIAVRDLDLSDPVWLDLLTGRIHEIPTANMTRIGDVTAFSAIPVFDSPVVLTDRSILEHVKARQTKKRVTKEATPIPRRGAADGSTVSLKSFRLFGSQKPAPAVVICCPGDGTPEWAGPLAEQLRAADVHAFTHTGTLKGVSEAVSEIRVHATEWQVDPEQVGVLGQNAELADYAALRANFAIVLHREAGQETAAPDGNVRIISNTGDRPSISEKTPWLKDLLTWLEPRKTDVF